MQPFWIWRSDATRTHTIHNQRITPWVQSIGLRWPRGGWLWQFPLAVEIADQGTGEARRLPVPDTTRTTLWFIYALTLIVVVAVLLSRWRSKSSRKVR